MRWGIVRCLLHEYPAPLRTLYAYTGDESDTRVS